MPTRRAARKAVRRLEPIPISPRRPEVERAASRRGRRGRRFHVKNRRPRRTTPAGGAANRSQAGYGDRLLSAHRARSHAEAERWDLEFWQAMTPQERLSALVDIHHEVAKVKGRRRGLED